jgi:Ca2+-binding EF-hand superfamily protein
MNYIRSSQLQNQLQNQGKESKTKNYQKDIKSDTNLNAPFELDGDVKNIELKQIEQQSIKRVYDLLINLEEEPSSDEDSVKKKYLREINSKANQKRMSVETHKNSFMVKEQNQSQLYSSMNYQNSKISSDANLVKDTNFTVNKKDIKISQKALRKILRKLISLEKLPKDEIDTMIWEVDEDMDGRVSLYEIEKMYKRCINDTEELEPKRLFYLIQFLMYDKDSKFYITEEDTLELLYIRYGEKFNSAIDDIFKIMIKDQQDQIKKAIKDKVYYEEFIQKMISIALKKRAAVKDKRKNYCSYISKEDK